MRRRLATPAALAVLVLGLTACSGDDGTGPITEAPSYPNQGSDDGGESPEESDGGGEAEGDEQAAPDIPAPDPADYPGMDKNTPEGAEQFADYYNNLLYWTYQTGDASLLEEKSAGDCEGCYEQFVAVAAQSDSGLYWEKLSVDLEDSKIYDSESFDYEVGSIYNIRAQNSVAESPLAGKDEIYITTIVAVEWRESGWIAAELVIGETGSSAEGG